ncbi:hypothetical protein GC176_18525 [bacterium]|nr:hypothetical protein [bacterium]
MEFVVAVISCGQRLAGFARIPAIGLLCLMLAGCSLLSSERKLKRSSGFELAPIVVPRDAVQLDLVFVDRPQSDPLLQASLWKEIDEIAGLSPQTRTRLHEAGWRIGMASSRPPRALEELLELASDRPDESESERRLVGRRVAVPAGTEFPIEVTDLLPELRLQLVNDERVKTWSDAKAVLRVRVEREQDGWVRLVCTPEIHHGKAWLRPIATPQDWQHQRTQNIEPLYELQFELSLNLGEMGVVTALNDVERSSAELDSVGHAFFHSVEPTGKLQRLLIIRVADMRRMTPVYDH